VKGGFGKHVFLMLSLVKMYVYLKVVFEMCVFRCVKILHKMVKIRVFI
jgi:hypothetical protein